MKINKKTLAWLSFTGGVLFVVLAISHNFSRNTLVKGFSTQVPFSSDNSMNVTQTKQAITDTANTVNTVSNTIKTATTNAKTAITGATKIITSDNNENQDNLDVTPEVKIIKPEKKVIQGKTKLEAKVKEAESVDFYLVEKGSNIDKYIGSAKKKGNDDWNLDFDSKRFPNGAFYLETKIKNAYGSYKSGKKALNISNGIDKAVEEEINKERNISGQEVNNKNIQNLSTGNKTIITGNKITTKGNKIVARNKTTNNEANNNPINNKATTVNKITVENKTIARNKTTNNEASNSLINNKTTAENKTTTGNKVTAENNKVTTGNKTTNNKVSNNSVNNKTIAGNKNQANNRENNANGLTTPEWQKRFFKQSICHNKNICGGNADPDKDGLTNNEEFRYHTNPLNPDSDNDGYLDGDEIKNGFNPLKYSPGDKSDRIVFESPKKQGKVKADIYQVKTVTLKKEANQKEALVLKGKGLPDSFVNVYIYSSQPTILVVRTDKNGNWSYTLNKPLENGEHQVYVAVTDNTGKITAKSKPLTFVKTAQAVSVTPPANTYVSPTSSTDNRKKYNLAVAVILALISLGLAISIIGIIVSKSKAKRNK